MLAGGVDDTDAVSETAAPLADEVLVLDQIATRDAVDAARGPQLPTGHEGGVRRVLVDRLGQVPTEVELGAGVLPVAEVRLQLDGVDREAVLGQDVAVGEEAQQVALAEGVDDLSVALGELELLRRGRIVQELLQRLDVLPQLVPDLRHETEELPHPAAARQVELVGDAGRNDPTDRMGKVVRDR